MVFPGWGSIAFQTFFINSFILSYYREYRLREAVSLEKMLNRADHPKGVRHPPTHRVLHVFASSRNVYWLVCTDKIGLGDAPSVFLDIGHTRP